MISARGLSDAEEQAFGVMARAAKSPHYPRGRQAGPAAGALIRGVIAIVAGGGPAAEGILRLMAAGEVEEVESTGPLGLRIGAWTDATAARRKAAEG